MSEACGDTMFVLERGRAMGTQELNELLAQGPPRPPRNQSAINIFEAADMVTSESDPESESGSDQESDSEHDIHADDTRKAWKARVRQARSKVERFASDLHNLELQVR